MKTISHLLQCMCFAYNPHHHYYSYRSSPFNPETNRREGKSERKRKARENSSWCFLLKYHKNSGLGFNQWLLRCHLLFMLHIWFCTPRYTLYLFGYASWFSLKLLILTLLEYVPAFGDWSQYILAVVGNSLLWTHFFFLFSFLTVQAMKNESLLLQSILGGRLGSEEES